MNVFTGVYTWGWNNKQLGYQTDKKGIPQKIEHDDFNKVKLVALGGSHNLLVTADNQIYVWGKNQR